MKKRLNRKAIRKHVMAVCFVTTSAVFIALLAGLAAWDLGLIEFQVAYQGEGDLAYEQTYDYDESFYGDSTSYSITMKTSHYDSRYEDFFHTFKYENDLINSTDMTILKLVREWEANWPGMRIIRVYKNGKIVYQNRLLNRLTWRLYWKF